MLSDRFEHALRLMVILGRKYPQAIATGELAATSQLTAAETTGYLSALEQAGLVRPAWACGRPTNEITLLQVMDQVAPIKRITACPMGYTEHGANLCLLHRTLDNALGALQAVFRKMTLQQILIEPELSRPLCRFPREL
jgi:DNA-binding IscR family transcriptional regulator